MRPSTVIEALRPTLLEPGAIQAIVSGRQPRCLSLLCFQRNTLPPDWQAKRELIAKIDA